MRRDGWDVISNCEKCDLMMTVDLERLIRKRGPNLSPWNRKARCRRLGCRGYVSFPGKAPGMSMHEPIEAEDE